jgi:excinuclease UvrABC ATPase subunit
VTVSEASKYISRLAQTNERGVDERRVMNEFIDIRGERENNLKDVSLRVPKRKITDFTGVSGSGKSSIVFDYTLLRLRFSRVGKPHAGYPNAFSFNDPQGMCSECSGLGKKVGVASDDFIDKSKSLKEGP